MVFSQVLGPRLEVGEVEICGRVLRNDLLTREPIAQRYQVFAADLAVDLDPANAAEEVVIGAGHQASAGGLAADMDSHPHV